MTVKGIFTALVLWAASLTAHAAVTESTFPVNLVGSADSSFSAGISRNITAAGLFTDTYTFASLAAGWYSVSAVLSTRATLDSVNIDFYSISLNGVAFNLRKTPQGTFADGFELGTLPQQKFEGPLVMVVTGRAGGALADGSAIGAGYSGTINILPAPVPEPSAALLMLTGLGAVGFMARRRRRQ
ncbi:FxDxF family PEP-CTERM protein [Pelomonas sp. CA6]|uniref:FxDxF family PEP-CTERM protein n=1 Tax=Pelomonas sp. CA6 TaxID=2907999 RepID=UPI001F4AD0F8|nr:FxDxF family PEP-CTERM protein [Pelomonas sp. CA6]MCH7341946.1 FxDxF family PEP-CTERM protein [Pelomonas sp. CA6]